MEVAGTVLDCAKSVKRALPADAVTLHRLLGSIPGTADFRHHRDHPIAADAVIIDEASMVDLALMAKLVEALPEHCRLILMGDRHQLASVQAGAVMGDLCGRRRIPGISQSWAHRLTEMTGMAPAAGIPRERDAAGLSDAIVLLRRNFRFSAKSGIGRFSRSINRGDGAGALQTASGWPSEDSVCWIDAAADRTFLHRQLADIAVLAFAGLVRAESPKKALEQARRFKILCAVNRGPLGVDAFNELAVRALQQRGLVARIDGAWYPGRPVLILENDYLLGLFNGDLGVTMPDPATGGLQVYFPTEAGGLRSVSPVRIPAHQTAFAMTVHKSQGSEFDEVLLVLPERDMPVLTRELIYTGATRARRRVILCGTESMIESAASHRIERNSGLLEALWGKEPDGQEGT
jgi:exodeoxyribonuclease V alpha subunit